MPSPYIPSIHHSTSPRVHHRPLRPDMPHCCTVRADRACRANPCCCRTVRYRHGTYRHRQLLTVLTVLGSSVRKRRKTAKEPRRRGEERNLCAESPPLSLINVINVLKGSYSSFSLSVKHA